MLINRRTWPEHRPWFFLVLILALAATLWELSARIATGVWPGGSSLPGFTFGVVGGLIMTFEFLLWPRKKKRVWRVGRAQTWLRAHIWLGFLLIPLIAYHSGFRWGGTLSTVLAVLFILVIASGILGLVFQQFLPRKILDEVPAETIYSQIDRISQFYRHDAAQLVRATCGPAEDEPDEPEDLEDRHETRTSFVTIGAVRSAGRVQGKVLQTRVPATPVPRSEPLRVFFRETVAPYLLQGARSGMPLRYPNRADVLFRDLRTKLDPAAHDAVDALEDLCNQRRQLDHEARLHLALHGWLWVHLPLSIGVMVLMFVHIFVALRYW